jgi:hypothetical protein
MVHPKNPFGFYTMTFKGQEIEHEIDTVVLVNYHPKKRKEISYERYKKPRAFIK